MHTSFKRWRSGREMYVSISQLVARRAHVEFGGLQLYSPGFFTCERFGENQQ